MTDKEAFQNYPAKIVIKIESGEYLHNDDIVENSVKWTRSLSDETSFVIGKCNSSSFEFTVYEESTYPKRGQEIFVWAYADVPDDDEEDYICYIGKFYVYSNRRTQNRLYREIVCYDRIYSLGLVTVEKWLKGFEQSHTGGYLFKDMKNSFFEYYGLTDRSRVNSWIREAFEISGLSDTAYSMSARDFLQSMCEWNGANGYIDGSGNFRLICKNGYVWRKISISKDDYSPSQANIEDYYVKKVGELVVILTKEDGEERESYVAYENDNVYTITDNLFAMANGINEFIAKSIYLNAEWIIGDGYNPYSVTSDFDPYAELGDTVEIEGIDGEKYTSRVMHIEVSGLPYFKMTIRANGEEEYGGTLNVSSNVLGGLSKSQVNILQNSQNLEGLNVKVLAVEEEVADKITVADLTADNLKAGVAQINSLTADDAFIKNIQATAISSEYIESEVAKIGYLKADDIESDTGAFHYLYTDVLEATYATIAGVRAGYADIDFANVNVANIGSAKLTEFFSRSGYVQHETVGTEDVQYLRGVKIVGDIIEADTISAKSLILRNETETGDYTDGLIWQINAQSGELTQQQLTEEQYRKKLDGTDLVAHSVTAREITTEKIQGSTGYIQFGDEVLDDGTIVRGPNLNLNNELIYRNGKLELNLASLDIKIGNAVNYAIDNVTIGGRNLLLNTGNISVTHSGGSTPYTIGGLYPSTSIPSGTQITISVQLDATDVVWGSSGYRRAGIEGYNGSQYIGTWGGAEVSNGNNIVKVVTGTWSGRVSKTFTLTADITTGTQFSLYVQQLSSGTMKVSNAKLEVGNKATDWSPAPEDSITYTDTVASKISSAKVVTSTKAALSLSDIQLFSTYEREEPWSNLAEDVSDFQIGDLVYVKRRCSNFNNAYVYIKGTVIKVNDSHSLTLSMLGFEAPMPTSNPIAYINATGETVKIEAKHVDITGAVTFSSFSSDLQSSYNSVSSNASNALTKANSASTAASNAQSTANSASSAAATAQTAANNANTTVNNVANTTVRRFTQTIDLSGSQYNQNTYYPAVTRSAMPVDYTVMFEVGCIVQLNSGTKPSWSTHASGFSVTVRAKYKRYGWGTTDGRQYCTENYYAHCDKQPVYACEQNMYNSKVIFMLRGGGQYFMSTEFYTDGWDVYTSQTDIYGSSTYPWYVAPVTDPAVSMSGNRSALLKRTSERDVLAWCRAEDVTKIDGGTIYTNSIKANSIDVTDLFAQKITASGSITSKSSDSSYSVLDNGSVTNYYSNDNLASYLTTSRLSMFNSSNKQTVALIGNPAGYLAFADGKIYMQADNPSLSNDGGNIVAQSVIHSDLGFTAGSDNTMSIKPQISNEVNFGGTDTSTTIFFGYRATDSRPKPENFVFGTGNGTANVKAKAFYENGSLLSNTYQAKGNYLASGGSIASGNTSGVTGGAIYSWLRGINNRTRLEATNSGTVSVSSGTNTLLSYISLSAGCYVLVGCAAENAGAGTHLVNIHFASSGTGAALDRFCQRTQMTGASKVTNMQVAHIMNITSTTTVYLVGTQDSGSNRTFSNIGIEALKIY